MLNLKLMQPPSIPDDAQGLVFDFDGTLVDSMRQHHAAWSSCLDEIIGPGHAFTLSLIVELAGTGIHDLFRIICKSSQHPHNEDLDKQFFAALPTHYEKNHQAVNVVECVLPYVEEGHRRGLPMAIASGGTRSNILKGLKETGLDRFFDPKHIVSVEDVLPGRGKPEPDGFLKASASISIAPHLCVGFEDASLGMTAIRAAGFLLAIDVTRLEGYPRIH